MWIIETLPPPTVLAEQKGPRHCSRRPQRNSSRDELFVAFHAESESYVRLKDRETESVMFPVVPGPVEFVLQPVAIMVFAVMMLVSGTIVLVFQAVTIAVFTVMMSIAVAMEALLIMMPVAGTVVVVLMVLAVTAVEMFFMPAVVMGAFVQCFVMMVFIPIVTAFSPMSVCPRKTGSNEQDRRQDNQKFQHI